MGSLHSSGVNKAAPKVVVPVVWTLLKNCELVA